MKPLRRLAIVTLGLLAWGAPLELLSRRWCLRHADRCLRRQ